jgi:hypothetical protein
MATAKRRAVFKSDWRGMAIIEDCLGQTFFANLRLNCA